MNPSQMPHAVVAPWSNGRLAHWPGVSPGVRARTNLESKLKQILGLGPGYPEYKYVSTALWSTALAWALRFQGIHCRSIPHDGGLIGPVLFGSSFSEADFDSSCSPGL